MFAEKPGRCHRVDAARRNLGRQSDHQLQDRLRRRLQLLRVWPREAVARHIPRVRHRLEARLAEAAECGAPEVCMQGGIHLDYEALTPLTLDAAGAGTGLIAAVFVAGRSRKLCLGRSRAVRQARLVAWFPAPSPRHRPTLVCALDGHHGSDGPGRARGLGVAGHHNRVHPRLGL